MVTAQVKIKIGHRQATLQKWLSGLTERLLFGKSIPEVRVSHKQSEFGEAMTGGYKAKSGRRTSLLSLRRRRHENVTNYHGHDMLKI